MTTTAKAIHDRLEMHVSSLEQTVFHAGSGSLFFSVEKAQKEEQQLRGALAFAHSLLNDLGLERDANLFARARTAVDSVRSLTV